MRIVSALVIFITPVLILVYDSIAYLIGGNPATISRVALDTSESYPSFRATICYLFGLLCVHLFAPRPGSGSSTFLWLPVVGAVGIPLVVAFVNLAIYLKPEVMRGVHESYSPLAVAVWLLVGVGVGWVTVAQHQGA